MIDKCIRVMPFELSNVEIGYFYDAVATDAHSGGVDMVSSLIMSEAMELWIYNEDETILCTVTRLITYPDGFRELLVQMMAGTNVTSTDVHLECERVMMQYAIRHGCSRMVAYMRPNIWEHMKGPLGKRYVPEYVILSLAPDAIVDATDASGSDEDHPALQHQNRSAAQGSQGNE